MTIFRHYYPIDLYISIKAAKGKPEWYTEWLPIYGTPMMNVQ